MVSDIAAVLVLLAPFIVSYIQVLHVLSDQHRGVEKFSQKPEVLA